MPITKVPGKKKDGLQLYRVRVNYTDMNGEYKQAEKSAYGYAEAQEIEAQLKRKLFDGDISNRMTVRVLSEEYIAAMRSNLRETTLDKKRRMEEGAILPVLGNVRLDKLTPQILQGWKDGFRDDLKTTTKQNYYKELNALLRFAFKRGYIRQNPLERVGNFRDDDFAPPKDKIRYYTYDEFLHFISAARAEAEERNDGRAWGLYTFFMIAFWCGLRKGEINALKWSDIDNGKIINVRRSIAQKLKGEDRETPPKTKSSYRSIEAPLPLIEALNEQRNRQKQGALWSEHFRVCGGEECLRDTTIEKANMRFSTAAGLKHISVHEFRHSHATLLANAGINIQEVARRLGHSDVKETWQTYAHLYPSEADRALSVLNDIANKK